MVVNAASAEAQGTETPSEGQSGMKFLSEWQKAEREPYEEVLPTCDLDQLGLVFKCVGQPRMILATGTAEDVKQLMGEKNWGEERLWRQSPGVAAAARVISERLAEAVKSLEKWAGAARRRQRISSTMPLTSAYAGPRSRVNEQEAHDEDAPCEDDQALRICGISCGKSGLASIGGDRLLPKRWGDMATLLGALGVDLAIATGCRQPAAVNEVLPDFPYVVDGPQSADFDACCLFRSPEWNHDVAWRTDLAATSRVTVGSTRAGLIVVGFYVPPRNENHTEEERAEVIASLREAIAKVHNEDADARIVGYGDLNPTAPLLRHYTEFLRSTGLRDILPDDCVTHEAGARPDRAFRSDNVEAAVTVHDADHCRRQGCTRAQCGQHRETFGPADLDHYAVVIDIAGAKSRNPREKPAWRTAFCG